METTFSKHALAYDRYALVQLFKAIEEFRGVDREMPAQGVALFLYSAIYPGCTMADLQKNLGMTQSSCSRNVSALSEWASSRKTRTRTDSCIARSDGTPQEDRAVDREGRATCCLPDRGGHEPGSTVVVLEGSTVKNNPQHQADGSASWLSRRRVMGVLLVAAYGGQPEHRKVHLLGCFPSAFVCGQDLAQQRMLDGASGSSQARSAPTPGLPHFAGDALHERDPSVDLCLDRATSLKSVCQAMHSRYTKGTRGQRSRAHRKISSGRRIRLPPSAAR